MKYKSILVVTYGRSGSTLLQGILNDIPQCIVRGENFNFIFHLFEAYQKLQKSKGQEVITSPVYNTPQHSWYGANRSNLDIFLKHQKLMIKEFLIGDSDAIYYGFKEIRYINILDKLEDFLNFLEQVMDDVAIIFNIRNPIDVSNSGWWKNSPQDKSIKVLNKAIDMFKKLSIERKNSFCFDYDELIKEDRIARELFSFLDVEYNKQSITNILAKEHSRGNRKKS
jgi:hypothetical protein